MTEEIFTFNIASNETVAKYGEPLAYFITIYTEIGFRNVTHSFFWQSVGTFIVCLFLRPFLLFVNYIITPAKNYRPPQFIASCMASMDSTLRAFHLFFDGVHYFWTLLVLIISIPYSRMQDAAKWNCYWSWVFETIVTVLLLIPPTTKFRLWVRKYTFIYLLHIGNGVMSVANFGYVYYKLASYTWPYLFVHFAPPAFIWFYCFIKSAQIPDEWNPLHISFFKFWFCLIIASFFQYWYLGWLVDVLSVYELDAMPNLYVIGGLAPQVTGLCVMLILMFGKALHARVFGWQHTEKDADVAPEDAQVEKKNN